MKMMRSTITKSFLKTWKKVNQEMSLTLLRDYMTNLLIRKFNLNNLLRATSFIVKETASSPKRKKDTSKLFQVKVSLLSFRIKTNVLN